MNSAAVSRPAWYTSASTEQHQALKTANAEGWRTHNTVQGKLRDVQDAYAFAEPLLKKAILDQYGLDLDVNTTFLNLYIAKDLPWYAVNFFSATISRKMSLLDAALHNFAKGETFEAHSCYISPPDYRGHFAILPLDDTMSIDQFKTLCRELDIGARYQQHLNNHLLPTNLVARAELKNQITASQKAALKAAAQLACLKTDAQQNPDLGAGAYQVLMRALRGERGLMQFYQLNILDASLTGILLIAADLDKISSVSKLIAYIPHDPESPVKEYNSTLEFMRDLTRKLQANAPLPSRQQQTYQQFFSQFVDHIQRGHFFAGLDQRLCQVKWHQKTPLDPRPQWREATLENPNLQFSLPKIEDDLWEHLYQQTLNKILNDGRSIAIPTADADSAYRWAWWDNFTKILSDIFNVALMVITPFVPGLGELMLAYTAYQLADDAIEGVVDLAEGQFKEAAEHLIAVTTDILQLGAFAAGGEVASAFKRSPFVDGMRAVRVGDEQRLWSPDLGPYAKGDLQLPADSRPDALGLHSHQNQKVLRLDNQHYVVEHDETANTYRVKHPTRPDAYSPTVDHNGSGAWIHEGENPRTWDSETLRSRLGPVVDGLTPTQLEQACETSGTHDGALRMMYANRDTPPPLLADSLKRMKLRVEIEATPEKIRTGAATDLPTNWSAQTTSELQGWPSNKAIKVFIGDDLVGDAMPYGAMDATDANTLKISHQDVQAGKLPEQLSVFLSETELSTLLSAPVPETAAGRIKALRDLLANTLEQEKAAVFNHLYSTQEVSDTPHGRLIQQQFPQLPKDLVATLLLRTSPQELTVMSSEQRIPLRLKNLARALANEVRASHASEGFYNDALLTPDTERMALNIVRQHTDALGDLNIAIHEQTPDGALRCQVGPAEAGTKKILVYKGQGRYQIHEAFPQGHPPQYSFYEALLRAVPAEKLDYLPGQGGIFKEWLKDQLKPLAERRTVLQVPTRRAGDERTTQILLQKPMFGGLRRLILGEPPRQPPTLKETLATLCPRLSEEQIQAVTPHLNTPQGERLLKTLEADRATLDEDMDRFRKKRPSLDRATPNWVLNEKLMRDLIILELKVCWEEGAYLRMLPPEPRPRGTLLDLSELVLGRYIRGLEPLRADFSHVTRLNLNGTRLDIQDVKFLDNFPNLRALDLSGNELDEIPWRLSKMKDLTALNLSDNPITWSPDDYKVIKQCPQLRSLSLEGHTNLTIPPNLTLMTELRRLVMRRTSVIQWPTGMESRRGSIPELDFSNTPLNTVPDVAPDSVAARIVAYSWLDRAKLGHLDEDRFVSYRRNFGIDPYRTVPRGGKAAREYWMYFMASEDLDYAVQIWDDVEKEHGSQGFFDVLKLLRPPEQFQTDTDVQLFQQGREDLTTRVWQVLFAVDENPEFRDRMFSLAGTPANCADAGAHIFNRMGVETLLENIRNDDTPLGLATRESNLVKLAKQSWRLDQVNQLARKEIQHRVTPTNEGGLGQAFGSGPNQVDDVQVYLAYQTGLKTRLDLPWLSKHMVYRDTARVTQTHLDTAFGDITQREQGDGLVNGLLEQPFWSDYLHDAYLEEFNTQREKRANAGSQLEDLLEAQQEWASAQVTPERKASLREQLITLADELVIPHTVVLAEQPLSDATVRDLYDHIQHDYNELGRRLTRDALQNAGL
ncbi:NEL-type E3 ubiquitin ligase domain-containing protein [Pseudomonas sp. ADAK18]|uniref:NEL-type E3 ubiquitin ligase domain-containing protein n=1 Tax=Pseudomonas sp. ADAK18 TaxID=2730848 RepID=UPI001F15B903|nr:NEL-type E3 ubiquitin ligase domain-containing protein [Pseudomonas sp. ADAK18]